MMTPQLLRLRPFVLLLLLCLLSVRARSESCGPVAEVFGDLREVDANGASVRPSGHVYDQMSASENADDVCRLDSTCCSRDAERSLQSFAVRQYEDQTTELLSERLYTCYNSSITGALQHYLQEQKDSLVAAMLNAYQDSFRPYVNIFDSFYAYLQQAVVTGNVCDLPEQFNRVFFELFLAVYIESPFTPGRNALPDTDAFRQCFYEYFLELYSRDIYYYYNGFSRSFNHTLLYIRALRTGDTVIESILAHRMASTCRDSLMKMTFCAQCAGYRSPQPCQNLCLNTMRGCLVELSNFAGEFERFGAAVVRMKDSLESGLYNPWTHIPLLRNDFFRMIDDVLGRVLTIQQDLQSRCSAQGRINSNAKRQTFGGIATRATIEPPTTELNQSAHCYTEIVSIFAELPDLVCEEKGFTRNENCWNGRGVGSYGRSVTGFWWEAQRDNPEVLVCPQRRDVYREEIALLQHMTRELDILTGHYVCNPDDEDCSMTVESTCSYQVPMVNVDDFEFSGERFAVSGDSVGSAPDPCEVDSSGTTPTTATSPTTDTEATTHITMDTGSTGTPSDHFPTDHPVTDDHTGTVSSDHTKPPTATAIVDEDHGSTPPEDHTDKDPSVGGSITLQGSIRVVAVLTLLALTLSLLQ